MADFQKKRRKRMLLAVLIPVTCLVLVISLWQVFAIQSEYKEATNEYDMLRQQALPPLSGESAVSNAQDTQELPLFDLKTIAAANADCVGWIYIPNTTLSYPLVQSSNNEKYLNHTFMGNENDAGAIFMDYRNPANLEGQHLIFYGHNMKNGSMFGLLPQYLNREYLQDHSTLVLYNQDKIFTYEICNVRVGDAHDPCYRLDFASPADFSTFAKSYRAPADTTQMLTLSTCTNTDADERILAHAYLVSTTSA